MADSTPTAPAPEAPAKPSETHVAGESETDSPPIAPADEALSPTPAPYTVEGAEADSNPIAPAPEASSTTSGTSNGGNFAAERSSLGPAPGMPLRTSNNRVAEDPEKQHVEEVREDLSPKGFSPSAVSVETLEPGYAKLAADISMDPSRTIFRSFPDLNTQTILYMQAELIVLEKELRARETTNFNSFEPGTFNRIWDWKTLRDSPEWVDVMRIRALLKEYNEALLTYSKVLHLEAPLDEDIMTARRVSNELPGGDPVLKGSDNAVWGSVTRCYYPAPDLCALHPRQVEDSMSRWIGRQFYRHGYTLQRFFRPWKEPTSIKNSRMVQVTAGITSTIASLLPVASVVVLYAVKSVPVKFGIIAAFNLAISLCLSLLTNAKRTDVFAITAAFVAVQVVFVGVNEN